MLRVLRRLVSRAVRAGRLTIIDADGHRHVFEAPAIRLGTSDLPPDIAPSVTVRLFDRRTERAIAIDPYLSLGEAYKDGKLVMEEGSIYDLIALLMHGSSGARLTPWVAALESVRGSVRRLRQLNNRARAQENVAHHYDIDDQIYALFLDPDRQYSCAYFPSPSTSLDEAQLLKKRHIAAKLDVEPGHRVLDIGSGWGGLALYLARTCEANVTGITLSTEQLAVARRRASDEGLLDAVRFELADYREARGRFDRIVSVGMLEHVGVNHYRAFFDRIAALLEDDGVALIHTIGRTDGPGHTNPFIERYIFPGGYFPALSELLSPIERSGLIVTDVEVLRLHYAETLKAWRERFLSHRAKAVELRGEAFARMWEFYLAGSEAAFRHQGLVVFQLQLTRRIDALPVTRDYIGDAERRFAGRESRRPVPWRMAGE